MGLSEFPPLTSPLYVWVNFRKSTKFTVRIVSYFETVVKKIETI